MPEIKKQDYLKRDFSTIRLDIEKVLKIYFPKQWQDFNVSSAGMALVDLLAYVSDLLSYYTDKRFNELFLDGVSESSKSSNYWNRVMLFVSLIALATSALFSILSFNSSNEASVRLEKLISEQNNSLLTDLFSEQLDLKNFDQQSILKELRFNISINSNIEKENLNPNTKMD